MPAITTFAGASARAFGFAAGSISYWGGILAGANNGRFDDVAADNNGNLYITGQVNPTGSNTDGWAAKFDKYGNFLFDKTINSTGSVSDSFESIAVDRTTGDFVIGGTNGTVGFLRKYDFAGSLVWEKVSNTNMGFKSLALDSSGNIYGVDSFFKLSKFNSSGTLQFAKQADTPSVDSSGGVKVDSSGNIYTFGRNTGGILLKFNSSAALTWGKEFGSGLIQPGSPRAITFDSLENVIIAIRDNSNIYVLKISSAGAITWQTQLALAAGVVAVSCDANDNIYVATTVSSRINFAKLNSSGTLQFARELYVTTTGGTLGSLRSINVDFDNSICVVGAGGPHRQPPGPAAGDGPVWVGHGHWHQRHPGADARPHPAGGGRHLCGGVGSGPSLFPCPGQSDGWGAAGSGPWPDA
jgi:hypothetical protein